MVQFARPLSEPCFSAIPWASSASSTALPMLSSSDATLARMGGSDMMEVAALAKPVVVGPHTENFADTMRQFEADSAIRVLRSDLESGRPADELAEVVGALLACPEAARSLGAAGREVVKRNRGAIDRTLNALVEVMQHAKQRAS